MSADEEDVVREALRWPPDTHHIGCESKRVSGATCDCYAFLTNRAHEALDRLVANRDQWHSAANEAAEERDEALHWKGVAEANEADYRHGRDLARLDTQREQAEVERITEALKMVLWSLEGIAADSVHPLHAAVYHAHEVLAADAEATP